MNCTSILFAVTALFLVTSARAGRGQLTEVTSDPVVLTTDCRLDIVAESSHAR